MATVAYAQLIAENARLLNVPAPLTSIIFHFMVLDLSAVAMSLISLPHLHPRDRVLLRRVVRAPKTAAADWEFLFNRIAAGTRESAGG